MTNAKLPPVNPTSLSNDIDPPLANSQISPLFPQPHTLSGSKTHYIAKGISLKSFNACSLRNKIDELKCILANEKPDVVCICETHLDLLNKDLLHEYQIDQYNFFHKDRNNGKKGGGVAMYVASQLDPVEVNLSESNMEILCVKLNVNNVNIVTAYRPPKQSAQNDVTFYKILGETLKKANETVFLGDYNLPHIDWNNLTGVNEESHRMIEFILDNFLTQHVKEPTRERNILDLVITTHEDLISSLDVREHLSTSDHKMLDIRISANYTQCKSQTLMYDFKNANFDNLRASLSDLHGKLSGINDPSELWESFKLSVLENQNLHIPMKPKSEKHTSPPWFNRNIGNELKRRNLLYTLKNNTPNNVNLSNLYKASRREVKKKIRSEKRKFELNLAAESATNPKRYYGYVNNTKRIKCGIGPLEDDDGQTVTGDRNIANLLNNYFVSVFTKEIYSPTAIDNTSEREISNFTISDNDVLEKLKDVNMNKTPGPDTFHPRIIKNIKMEIAAPLARIFNQSLEEGFVPSDWKDANITPIHKKGSRTKPNNYRPISLTSVIGKLMEKFIRDKIVEYLEANNLIRDSQHGFRNRKSCLTNLIEFYDKLFTYNDMTKSLDIIYLDFQKAFDKVPHLKLLDKLEKMGIKGKILAWIKSWLTGRRQRVVINGVESEWQQVTSGVPQGSVLGPILFLIYINDIDIGLNNIISKFADDTKIGFCVLNEDDRNRLQSDLNKIVEWSEKWQMPFNVDKCQVLQVGSKNNKYSYEMNGKQITSVQRVTDLGIIIAETLKTSEQCVAAANKANRALGFIKRKFTYKSEKIVLPLYKSMVRPHLEYAVQFWAPYLKKDIERLENVQRRATKMIPSLRHKSYHERLKRLNLFSLKKRRLRGQLIECFKILKGFNRLDRDELFTLDTDDRTRSNGMKLKVKKANLDVTQNFFTYSVIPEWNKLPRRVVECRTINTFKRKLDAHLKEAGVV